MRAALTRAERLSSPSECLYLSLRQHRELVFTVEKKTLCLATYTCHSWNTWESSYLKLKLRRYRVRTVGGVTLIIGLCLRCLRASGVAVKPMVKCCAQCRRVPRRNVWTPCTSLISAAPSAKTVGATPVGTVWPRAPAVLCFSRWTTWGSMVFVDMSVPCHIDHQEVRGRCRWYLLWIKAFCLTGVCFVFYRCSEIWREIFNSTTEENYLF